VEKREDEREGEGEEEKKTCGGPCGWDTAFKSESGEGRGQHVG
jgi:hypothetical protein